MNDKNQNIMNCAVAFFIVIIAIIIMCFSACSEDRVNYWEQEGINANMRKQKQINDSKFESVRGINHKHLSVPQLIEDRARLAGLSEGEAERLKGIAYCESRYLPTAQNRNSSAAGVFQIVKGTFIANSDYSWSERYDATANIDTAIKIYKKSGFGQWVCA